jgi:RNA polymerase sigma-70 factor (ECF subfamily)
MANSTSDEQLIQWYQKGDAAAFETLYLRYKNAIYHYFYRQVQSGAIADELHQDVWLNIIKSSSRFNQQASFKTWLYKVAHNRLVDHYRKMSRQSLHLVQDETPESHREDNTETEQHATKPDDILQQQQLDQFLLDGIEQLPAEQKEVFLLYENRQLSLEEIASVTNSTYESTKSRLRYAVKKLRQHLTLSKESLEGLNDE